MSIELPKAYNPKETEEKIYKLWLESGFFSPEGLPSVASPCPPTCPPNLYASGEALAKDGAKKDRFVSRNFATCIAPPNITGELHMGHALELTLQDIVVRMKRMQGLKTLWLPGTDHAGIAAQNVVERELKKEGLSRHNLGREKFTEKMWQWKEKYGSLILEQLQKLGCSLDWQRLRFTMDEEYQRAVQEAFIHYYKKGWIYRGTRVVNWCVRCETGISDLEVNYVPEKAKLYYIKYGPFTLATVRPETKLGDTALAVHPDDKRYKDYIGKDLEIESVDNNISAGQPPQKKKIKLRVVADKSVDPKFGTGIVKVTPAHDLTDSEIAERHGLPSLKIIGEQGRMGENAGIRYQGMKTSQAREQIVKDLQRLELMEKIEDYEHNIAKCDRCDSTIEPLPSEQWFLKMKNLAGSALKALDNKKIKFYPSRWEEPYKNWLHNIRDWNISRQLWWGHRLPVWFHEPKCVPRPGKEKEIEKCVDIKVSPTEPVCDYCNAKYLQSEDVLDTWFSSALWPFATLGWPNSKIKNPADAKALAGRQNEKSKSDFEEYYPTDFITSDRSILFLWIVRMVFSGMELTGKAPFKEILIHPTVLTKEGKRMSKSLGTGINPMELTGKYGTDALRFGLAYQTTGIQDMRFNEDVIMMGKKFANKIWNISRYVLMNTSEIFGSQLLKPKKEHNKRILEKLNFTIRKVTSSVEQFEFGEAAHNLYAFVWHDFADIYIEESKSKDDQETKDTLMYVLTACLKLLHPFMPFVTEEIYSQLPIKNKGLLLIESWPT